MRSAFSALLSSLMVFFLACQQAGDNSQADSKADAAAVRARQAGVPISLVHFTDAEHTLANGNYRFAAQHLHKGIIAYRTETGKMRGAEATQANRAIDRLIQLRKNLREGKAINSDDLHMAIQVALAIESPNPRLRPEQSPASKRDIIVPVGGH